MKYSQPDFYTFSEDSIHLARFAIAKLAGVDGFSLLDLCAGCGVVGLEIAQASLGYKKISFLEAQAAFLESLNANISELALSHKTEVLSNKFQDISSGGWDYIVCNPPYYDETKGRPSSDVQRHMCLHYPKDFPEQLVSFIKKSLKDNGRAWVCLNRKHQTAPWENIFNSSSLKIELIDYKYLRIYELSSEF